MIGLATPFSGTWVGPFYADGRIARASFRDGR